ncbi:MAG: ATP-binding protein, partial [Saprospiraceae bacterium]|nr:ATP-binding protein [Saprospiraceae bacterium]
MKQIRRVLEQKILQRLQPGKVIVLYGARRTGKTYLLRRLLEQVAEPYLLLNGEDKAVQDQLAERSVAQYRTFLGDRRLLVVDEAQKIPEIGAKLKLMVDEIEGLKVLVTGSSAFDIHQQFGEPLTGRKLSYRLFPIAEMEWASEENMLEQKTRLHERLVLGSYPELIHLPNREQKTEYLRELVSSYLLKDILEMEGLRHSSKLQDLLRLIAFQIGSEVSLNELSRQIGMDVKTVDKYL